MTTRRWRCIILVLSGLISIARRVDSVAPIIGRPNVTQLIEELLSRDGYDSKTRPGANSGKPVTVHIDIFINDISAISEVNMEYTITIYLRQTWLDERLAYGNIHNKSITLNYNQYDRVWSPDLFFRNQKDGKFHSLTVPNRLLRLSANGTILYSQRLSLVLSCEMDLKRYPMDNQTCTINIGSYGYTTEDLVFQWKPVEDPVQMKDGLQLPEFYVADISADTCTKNYSVTGVFTCIQADIKFQRQFEFYLIQTYVPTMLIVMLSWVSFWIDMYAVPARITLGLLTVLTITTQSASTMERLPRVSYIKAIDLWQSVCLLFVFAALIEYSVVNVLSRRYKKFKDQPQQQQQQQQQQHYEDLQGVVVENDNSPGPNGISSPKHTHVEMNVDAHIGHTKPHHPVTKLCSRDPDNYPLRRVRSNPEQKEMVGSEDEGDGTRAKEHHPLANFPSFVEMPWRMMRPIMPRKTWFQKVKANKAMMVDAISRVLFPGLFVVFNFVYWLGYYPL